MSRRFGAAGLALLLAMGLAVRLLCMSAGLGYDESQHFLIARSPLYADFWRECLLRAHPPLSYLAMKLALAAGLSAFWARSSALASNLLAGALAYPALLAAAAAPATALAGAAAAVFLPLFVSLAVEARGYSLCLVFVWSSLWLTFRLDRSERRTLGQYLLLGFTQLCAVLCEYSAVFHVAAILATTSWPLIAQRRRREAMLCAGPHLAALGVGAAFYLWHFGVRFPPPLFPHTEPYVYHGILSNLKTMGSFLFAGGPRLFAGILPSPWSWAVPALVLSAWNPAAPYDPSSRCAAYSFLVLILVFAAALAGSYPFGGVPRHTAVLLPGVVMACVLGAARLVAALGKTPRSRAFFSTALGMLMLPGFVLGIQRLRRAEPVYDVAGWTNLRSAYEQNPGPWIANWRGRSLLSWWFLADRLPRLATERKEYAIFDYSGIRVTQMEDAAGIVRQAKALVREHGRCWILVAYFRFDSGSAYSFKKMALALKQEPSISIALERWDRLEIPVLLMRLAPRAPPFES